jgi:hypothetical protein
MLFRSVDRLLRPAGPDVEAVLAAVEAGADAVSGRVLLLSSRGFSAHNR